MLRGLLYQMAAMAGNMHRVAGQLLGALLVGDAGLKFGDDRERMHPEGLPGRGGGDHAHPDR